MIRRLLPVIVPVIIAALAPAQNTYTVDPSGSGQFVTLKAALQVGVHGDTIIVKAGYYDPFTTDQGLTIISSYGMTFKPGGIVIRNIPLGRSFRMHNWMFQTGIGSEACQVVIHDCKGRVQLDGVSFPWGGKPSTHARVDIDRCSWVSLHEFLVDGGKPAAMTVDDSTVTLSNCGIGGLDEGHGLMVTRSRVWTGGSRLFGSIDSKSPQTSYALVCNSGEVSVQGGLIMGQRSFPYSTIGPDMHIAAGVVRISPETGAGRQLTSTGPVAYQVAQLPLLRGREGVRHGRYKDLWLELSSVQGAVGGIILSLPAVQPIQFGANVLFVNTSAMVTLNFGSLPQEALLAIPGSLPLGATFTAQAVVGTATGFELSNPVTWQAH